MNSLSPSFESEFVKKKKNVPQSKDMRLTCSVSDLTVKENFNSWFFQGSHPDKVDLPNHYCPTQKLQLNLITEVKLGLVKQSQERVGLDLEH